MTKRDVAVWFCRVVALVGMLDAGSELIGNLVGINYLGIERLMLVVPNFGLHFFVWFMAGGIGTELAAEGEWGPPMASGAQMSGLLLRCAGLWLFLSASVGLAMTLFSWFHQYLVSPASFKATHLSYFAYEIVSNLLKSVGGFCLAFAPRIRVFWRNTFHSATESPRFRS